MTPRFFVAPEAVRDLSEAVEWYDRHRRGLGEEFLQAFRVGIAAISRNPGLFATVTGEVRRILLRRFPYGVYYIFEPDRGVTVVGVEHHRRRPRRWQR